MEHARQRAEAVLQSRGEREDRRGPGGEAERRNGAHARGDERVGDLRLRRRGSALRARVPRSRVAAADVRRRAGGREAPDDGLHERRAGEDARLSPGGYRTVRAGSGEGPLETVKQVGRADCGLRIRTRPFRSAIRNRQSAILAFGILVAAPMTAQQWPVHSMDRPRPPVVDPRPERPPAPPPSDAVVLFDGKDLSQWQSQDSTAAKWVVRDGYVEVAAGTGVIMTKRGFGNVQPHIEWAQGPRGAAPGPAAPRAAGSRQPDPLPGHMGARAPRPLRAA